MFSIVDVDKYFKDLEEAMDEEEFRVKFAKLTDEIRVAERKLLDALNVVAEGEIAKLSRIADNLKKMKRLADSRR